jgi:hypothetical protein
VILKPVSFIPKENEEINVSKPVGRDHYLNSNYRKTSLVYVANNSDERRYCQTSLTATLMGFCCCLRKQRLVSVVA